jgi:putative nucleotidyltransferase with HDIG domain
MGADAGTPRPRLTAALALLGCAGCAVWFALLDHDALLDPLAIALFLLAVVASVAATRYSDRYVISGSLIAWMMSVGFLGPAPAFAIESASELTTWSVERYRRTVLAVNIVAGGLPVLISATVFEALGATAGELLFYVYLAAIAWFALALNYVIVRFLMGLLDGGPLRPAIRPFVQMAPATAFNVVLGLATAGIYHGIGLGGAVFVLVSMLAFSYMARLVVRAEERAEDAREQATIARERTRQYAALSWGVLSGLIRTLNERDPRAARHAAAVAAFARDIAAEVGMSERDQELAHTSGLLHDIGRFGLSDRVMERDTQLTDEDWRSIRRHPALGADMLKDLGVYGPVADIVRHHHERIDGRGYPDKLKCDEIPEIAKIVAVAEVYDTLTADDTYRTPVSSFQALTELRRVAGTQLETKYVETLSALLAGRSTDYRHADAADFDRELDLERRLSGAEAAPAQDAEAPTARSA